MTGTARSTFFFTIATNETPIPDVLMTCHSRHTPPIDTPTDGEIDSLNLALSDWWTTIDGTVPPMRTNFGTTVRLDKVRSQVIQPSPALPRELVVNSAGVHVGGQLQAPQSSLVMSLRTALATRRGRGRMYLPPPPATVVANDGLVTTAYHALVVASANRLQNRIDGAGGFNVWDLAVFSRVDLEARSIVDIRMGRRLDTQRRRLPREVTYLT